MVFLREEVDVSGGDDAHQFAAHFACLCDRNAREAMSYFGFTHIPNCVVWTHHNWVCNKTLLKPLKTKRNQTGIIIFFSLIVILFYVVKQQQQQEHQTKHHTQDRQQ